MSSKCTADFMLSFEQRISGKFAFNFSSIKKQKNLNFFCSNANIKSAVSGSKQIVIIHRIKITCTKSSSFELKNLQEVKTFIEH